MAEVKYKRVLLKLSGEALAGNNKTGIAPDFIEKICDKIKEIKAWSRSWNCRWRWKFLERQKWNQYG